MFGDGDELSNAGKIVDEQIQTIKTHYYDVKIDNYVIMPNHIHMLVTIGCEAMPDEEDTICGEVLGKYTHNGLEKIVGLFKSGVTREIHKVEPKIIKVWQRSYFDHIIVGKKEYDEIWDYIDANPIRWQIKYKILRDGQDVPYVELISMKRSVTNCKNLIWNHCFRLLRRLLIVGWIFRFP